MPNYFKPKTEKFFQVLYCIKGKKEWVYWRLKKNSCPCCGEPVGIIWHE